MISQSVLPVGRGLHPARERRIKLKEVLMTSVVRQRQQIMILAMNRIRQKIKLVHHKRIVPVHSETQPHRTIRRRGRKRKRNGYAVNIRNASFAV